MAAVRATRTAIFGTLQLAALEDGVLPIPSNFSVAIEIGASDRNTLDAELLSTNREYFVLALEPLVDKYARGLSRSRAWMGDHFQPLGYHHERGIILPFAVADVPTGGASLKINVGANAGCSSTLPLDRKSDRLKWCTQVKERRDVPAVPLEDVLGWLGPRRVPFLKVDAQGVDLSAVLSARARLAQIERFQLEVIADDCSGLYENQPKCTEVLARAAEVGFVPATDVFCTPRGAARSRRWRTTSWGCELEVVFVRKGLRMLPELWQFHNIAHSGCEAYVDNPGAAPWGALVMYGALTFCRAAGPRCVKTFHKEGGRIRQLEPLTTTYFCTDINSPPKNVTLVAHPKTTRASRLLG